MEIRYELSLKMRTLKGIEEYGCFSIGEDAEFAKNLYALLGGNSELTPDLLITIDLVKWENAVPHPIGILHCNCEQLAENVKIITKELFKQINLEN